MQHRIWYFFFPLIFMLHAQFTFSSRFSHFIGFFLLFFHHHHLLLLPLRLRNEMFVPFRFFPKYHFVQNLFCLLSFQYCVHRPKISSCNNLQLKLFVTLSATRTKKEEEEEKLNSLEERSDRLLTFSISCYGRPTHGIAWFKQCIFTFRFVADKFSYKPFELVLLTLSHWCRLLN